jgi:hypothetical protein
MSKAYPQLYSAGYGQMQPEELVTLATQLGAIVVDVRANPGDRGRCKTGFRRKQLESLLGDRYLWRGDVLPGFGRDTLAGRQWLGTYDRRAILLCAEHAPGDCHRHQTIAVPLFREPIAPAPSRMVLHYYEGLLIRADDLQTCIDTDSDDDDLRHVTLEAHIRQLRKQAAA